MTYPFLDLLQFVSIKARIWYDITPCQVTVWVFLKKLCARDIDIISVIQIRFTLAKIFMSRKKAALVFVSV